MRFPSLVRTVAFALLVTWAHSTSASPGPAAAQTGGGIRITGTLIGELDDRPLEGAWMTFLRNDSVEARATTASDGRFSVNLPEPGRYVIQVDLLGYADWTSPPMEIREPQDLTLLIPLAPIELEELVAEGLSECLASVEDLRAGAELLYDMTPVLMELEQNRSLEDYRYAMEVTRPLKGWERGNWRWVGRDTVRVLTDAVIAIEPPEVLVRDGYTVAVDDSTNLYRAPGPGTLPSEAFRRTHCISRVLSDTTDFIGLAFEPKRTGTTLEVAGTLWIDVQGGRPIPQRLEFTYVNVGPHLEERHVPWLLAWHLTMISPYRQIEMKPVDTEWGEYGGYLVFREITDGVLMITEWRVDQLTLGHRSLWIGTSALIVWPNVFGLPTHGHLLALVPKEM